MFEINAFKNLLKTIQNSVDFIVSALTYQSTSAPKTIQLPTAPRASRTVEIDHSRIPENGPFTAFVGNLPYEVDQRVLEDFFNGLTVVAPDDF